tara:strand:+ start:4141 stop:5208 length:1068 start_codon:yes stop_codon:yes gene_type:complete
MTNEQIDLLLNRILSGNLIFFYNDQEYQLRCPTPQLKYQSCVLYNDILSDEKYNTWIKEENMNRMMILLGIWDKDSDKMITSLEKKIEDLKLKLYESLKRPDQFKINKRAIKESRLSLNKLNNIKANFRNNTLEGYAESVKSEFIIYHTIYKDDKRLFPKPFSNKDNDVSYSLFNSLVQEIYKHATTIEGMKELARSGQWRAYWNCSKENIFPKTVTEWTDDQRLLVSFSRMYDNVYEHPEAPDQKVIEDDDVLDGWFIYQKNKREKQKKQDSFSKAGNNGSARNMARAQEIFLTPNQDQSVEDIMNLNDINGKMKIRERSNFLKGKGEVKEADLPDVQIELANQRAEMMRSRKR